MRYIDQKKKQEFIKKERKRIEDERKRIEDERKRTEDERKRTEDERKRTEDERKRTEDERKRTDLKDEFEILQSRMDSYGTLTIQVRGIVLALIAPTLIASIQIDIQPFFIVQVAIFLAAFAWLYFELHAAHVKDVLTKRVVSIDNALKNNDLLSKIEIYQLVAISRKLRYGYILFESKYYLKNNERKKSIVFKPIYKNRRAQIYFLVLVIIGVGLYFLNPKPNDNQKFIFINNSNMNVSYDCWSDNNSRDQVNESNEIEPHIGLKPNIRIKPNLGVKVENRFKTNNEINVTNQSDNNLSVEIKQMEFFLEQNFLFENLYNRCNYNPMIGEKI